MTDRKIAAKASPETSEKAARNKAKTAGSGLLINDSPQTAGQLLEIYQLLFTEFGPRGWWPADTPLEMVLGAILVQNVSWKNTLKALEYLKDRGLLDLAAIREAAPETIWEAVRSTRYYKIKTRKLKAFAEHIHLKHQGDLQRLLSLPLPDLRQELLGIYGIGAETADSIILYGSQQPIFVVDAYTKRIFQRLGFFAEEVTYRQMQEFFMSHLACDTALYNEYHALLDCLGNRLCSNTNPKCGCCPLSEKYCKYGAAGR